jgi:hypothetical protein
MTAITVPTTNTSRTAARTGLAARPVWLVGALAGILATIAATLVAIGAKAVGVPMEAAPAYEPAGQPIPLEGFVTLTLFSIALGTILAVVLARRSSRPAPTFLVVTIVLTMASFALPHTTHYATAATRIALDLTHIAAALVFIPVVAHRLSLAKKPTAHEA